MEVAEEEYRNYYRPWWQQKKREQRNQEVMLVYKCGHEKLNYSAINYMTPQQKEDMELGKVA